MKSRIGRTHQGGTAITTPTWGVALATIGLVATIFASGAAAKEMPADLGNMSLEELMQVEVVYGASKYEQKTSQAPSSVSIISSEEIARYGWTTLADLLQSTRGFFTTDDRNYTYVGVRGFSRPGDYNSRVLLLVDGHRMNDNVYDSGYYGTAAALDLNVIDRVEIIRGPSSSIYGTSAFFAVINIVTSRAKNVPGLQLAGTAASYDSYHGVARFGTSPESRWDIVASVSRMDSRGQDLYFREFDDPATNNGIAQGLDRDQATRYFVSASRGPFILQTAYVERDKEIPTAAYGTIFNDPRTHTTDLRSYVDLRFDQPILGTASIQSRVYFDRYWYSGSYEFDYPPPTENQDYADGRWWGTETQLAIPAPGGQRVVVGAEFRDNVRQAQGVFDVEPRVVYFENNAQSSNWALFIQDEFRPLSRVTLNGGLRYDHYETSGGTTNPRVGAIVAVDRATNVKLLYGSAFRTPNAYELYYEDPVFQKLNPSLTSETIYTYEGVLERRIGENLRGTASAFYYNLDGLTELVVDSTDGRGWYVNRGDIHASGIETEVEGRTRSGWIGRGSYSYSYAYDTETGLELSNSPRHLAKVNVSAPLMGGKLFLGAELQYVGPRRTVRGGRAGDYLVANITLLERSWWKRVHVSASLYNALDRQYGDPGSEEHTQEVIPQNGRNGRLTATYSF